MRRRSMIVAIVSSLFVLFYGSVYFFLSSSGRYERDAAILTEAVGPCFCAAMDEYWQPRGVMVANYGEQFLANSYGYLFYPLVTLDHEFWHPTKAVQYRTGTYEELKAWHEEQDRKRREYANQAK